MNKKALLLAYSLIITLLAVSISSCVKDAARLEQINPCDSIEVKYQTVIKPMLQTQCAIAGCHDGGNALNNLNVYAELKALADNGKLKERAITKKDMPQAGPMPDSLIQKLNCWLEAGAQNN